MVILSDYHKPLSQDGGIREKKPQSAPIEWDVAFNPIVGRCDEVFFSMKGTEGTPQQNSARIRVDGKESGKWIDLSTKQPLNWQGGSPRVVRGSREISCSNGSELDVEHSAT